MKKTTKRKETKRPDNDPPISEKNDTENKQPVEDVSKTEDPSSSTKGEQAPSANNEIDTLNERIKELENALAQQAPQVQEEKDKALRALAEMENYKKRSDQELTNFKKYASEQLITGFLPIMDSFDNACSHAEKKDNSSEDIINGFTLIQKQLYQVFEKLSIKKIEALNQPFDPNLHQAISQIEKDDTKEDTVIQEIQAGYMLHDRVIRPAMVVISK